MPKTGIVGGFGVVTASPCLSMFSILSLVKLLIFAFPLFIHFRLGSVVFNSRNTACTEEDYCFSRKVIAKA